MSKLTNKELTQQSKLLDSIEAKMKRIKELWEKLPNEDDLNDLNKQVGSIITSMEEIKEAYQSDDFPSEDYLNDVAKAAGNIASSLKEAAEAAEELPDDLDK